jgi:hypothetical protein
LDPEPEIKETSKSYSSSVADPIKLFFLRFLIFAVKLGNFIINEFSVYVNKHANLTAKNKKIKKGL